MENRSAEGRKGMSRLENTGHPGTRGGDAEEEGGEKRGENPSKKRGI